MKEYPQYWRFEYSYKTIWNYLEQLESLDEKYQYLCFQFQRFQDIRHQWRLKCETHNGNIPRDMVQEYSELLECPEDYDHLVNHAYILNNDWPRRILPHILCNLHILTTAAKILQENLHLYKITGEDLEKFQDIHYFNTRLLMFSRFKREKPEVRLDYLETMRSYLISEVTKGRLIITDPETGIELSPDDTSQREFALEYIKSEIEVQRQLIKQEIQLKESAVKMDNRHGFDFDEPIQWLGSVPSLVKLFETLCKRRMIGVPQMELPSLIEKHCVDAYQNPLNRNELLQYLNTMNKNLEEFPDGLIHWKETEKWIVMIITQLNFYDLLYYPEDKNGPKYADVIRFHFLNQKGSTFNKKQIHRVFYDNKEDSDLLEEIDKIILPLRDENLS